ncbi:PA14 domain-containing protein [Bdellovibrio sp. HCB290]|uniref:PA14 domain-containing protein n=1 Tax=Bdellovibrio sp. HCB290 TaxID=3394356 RepID=UPI0039B5548D
MRFSLWHVLLSLLVTVLFTGCSAPSEEEEGPSVNPIASTPTPTPSPSVSPSPSASPSPPPVVQYSISGTVSGLAHDSMTVRLNSSESVSLAAGATAFSFTTKIKSGDPYAVTILSHPQSPAIPCVLQNASSTVASADVTNIQISCPTLSSISVSNVPAQMNLGATFTPDAVGVYSDNQVRSLKDYGVWLVADTSILGKSGLVFTGSSAGSTSVSFSFAGTQVSKNITVKSVTLTSLQISPAQVTMLAATQKNLKVIGTYNDGSTQDLTQTAVWSSSDNSKATVDGSSSKGLVNAIAGGTANVMAEVGSISASRAITVSNSSVSSISLSPALLNGSLGMSQNIRAMAVLSDGSMTDVTGSAAWALSDASIASFTAGLVQFLNSGNTNISATLGAGTATGLIKVSSKKLNSLTLSDNAISLPVGGQKKVTVTANYDDNTTETVNDLVQWVIADTQVVNLKNTDHQRGTLITQGAGTSAVQVLWQGKTASLSVTVTAATVSTIRLSPAGLLIPKNLNIPLKAYATFSDGIEYEVTDTASFGLSNANIGQISTAPETKGTLLNTYSGSATVNFQVTASMQGKSTSTEWVMAPATLSSIVLNPTSVSIGSGKKFQARAYGQFSDGGSTELTNLVAWSSSQSSVVSVSNFDLEKGEVTSLNEGTAVLNATLGSVSGTLNVTVSDSASESMPEQGMGLQGFYYANKTLTESGFKGSRIDGTINFDWVQGAAPLGVGDSFSIKWTGKVLAQYSETYTFCTRSDDGVRLRVNNVLVVNNWTDHAVTENCGTIALVAGQKYDIQLEFFENGGYAVIQLYWQSPSRSKQIIPRQFLF